MPSKRTKTLSDKPLTINVLRYVDYRGRITLKNVVRCARYLLGSLACFAVVALYFKILGFLCFFIALFGMILLERSIYVVLGMQTR